MLDRPRLRHRVRQGRLSYLQQPHLRSHLLRRRRRLQVYRQNLKLHLTHRPGRQLILLDLQDRSLRFRSPRRRQRSAESPLPHGEVESLSVDPGVVVRLAVAGVHSLGLLVLCGPQGLRTKKKKGGLTILELGVRGKLALGYPDLLHAPRRGETTGGDHLLAKGLLGGAGLALFRPKRGSPLLDLVCTLERTKGRQSGTSEQSTIVAVDAGDRCRPSSGVRQRWCPTQNAVEP